MHDHRSPLLDPRGYTDPDHRARMRFGTGALDQHGFNTSVAQDIPQLRARNMGSHVPAYSMPRPRDDHLPPQPRGAAAKQSVCSFQFKLKSTPQIGHPVSQAARVPSNASTRSHSAREQSAISGLAALHFRTPRVEPSPPTRQVYSIPEAASSPAQTDNFSLRPRRYPPPAPEYYFANPGQEPVRPLRQPFSIPEVASSPADTDRSSSRKHPRPASVDFAIPGPELELPPQQGILCPYCRTSNMGRHSRRRGLFRAARSLKGHLGSKHQGEPDTGLSLEGLAEKYGIPMFLKGLPPVQEIDYPQGSLTRCPICVRRVGWKAQMSFRNGWDLMFHLRSSHRDDQLSTLTARQLGQMYHVPAYTAGQYNGYLAREKRKRVKVSHPGPEEPSTTPAVQPLPTPIADLASSSTPVVQPLPTPITDLTSPTPSPSPDGDHQQKPVSKEPATGCTSTVASEEAPKPRRQYISYLLQDSDSEDDDDIVFEDVPPYKPPSSFYENLSPSESQQVMQLHLGKAP